MQNNYNSTNNHEVIVDRVQGVIADLRRQRDQHHRNKTLSAERLRLVHEETDSMENTVNDLKEKVDKARADVSGDAKKELDELQRTVLNMRREVSLSGWCNPFLLVHVYSAHHSLSVSLFHRRRFNMTSWFARRRKWPTCARR